LTNDISEYVQRTKEHLELMIAKEKQSGDFLLASVVQDSLLYTLHHHAESRDLFRLAHDAAKISIQSAAAMMYFNEFTVCESLRGVMHSMVTLGGDPVSMAASIATGAVVAVQHAALGDAAKYKGAIVNGICSAADDLGIERTHIERASMQVVECITSLRVQ